VSKPTLDFTPFQAALGTKLAIAVKKNRAAADIVNDAGLKVLVGFKGGEGLVQLTRKATVARIKADLDKPVAGKIGRPSGGSGRTITRPLLFWLALNVLKRTGAGYIPEIVKQTMAAILKMRIKSRAYIAAGWLFAAKDLFEKSPGKHKFTRLKPRNIPTVETGTAATSFAVPAIPGRTTLTLVNTSRGGGTVGMEYAQQAINNATADIQVYIDREAGKQFARELFRTLKIT